MAGPVRVELVEHGVARGLEGVDVNVILMPCALCILYRELIGENYRVVPE